jgi:adenylylsulfate kinase-like enzyme
MRVAQLALEAVNSGDIAVCALISPYRETRHEARQFVGEHSFIEVFVDTPLAVCEARDTKGLYRRARSGTLVRMTGINDPYERPLSPDLVLTTTELTVQDNVELIIQLLLERRLL